MSIDQTILIGPYVVCSGERRRRFELDDERLSEVRPMTGAVIDGARVFVANAPYACDASIHLDPREHPQGEWAIPSGEAAAVAFGNAFAPELATLGKHFEEVDLRFGVLAWSW